ncbi:putative ferric-chelate reductase 1 homolog isoform X1 [Notechis scutatus]|uniref:Ferric-chelate reductase 1 homolog isoform X1 n=1 Tax=Notechis scutatus TaxID=8663 RepID=A0A6J1UPU0_9SAUR|nr:putative ferric-chelate reductase 1 homolog isoform X1 [Notechis scutatus]
MACWNRLLGSVLTFWTILGSNHAFPDGAPESACNNMLPVHIGVQPQTVPSPYELSVSTPSFQNGQPVNVQILGAAYRGLLLEARSFHPAAALGFWQTPPNNTRLLQCSGNLQGAITHSNTNLKMNQIYSWLPPPLHCPPVVYFVATVAQSHDVYWTQVKSKVIWRSEYHQIPSPKATGSFCMPAPGIPARLTLFLSLQILKPHVEWKHLGDNFPLLRKLPACYS